MVHLNKPFFPLSLSFFAVSRTMCGENSVHYWETPYTQPFFDNTTKRDITATVGQPALLHCRVRNLGDRAVSLSVLFCDCTICLLVFFTLDLQPKKRCQIYWIPARGGYYRNTSKIVDVFFSSSGNVAYTYNASQ